MIRTRSSSSGGRTRSRCGRSTRPLDRVAHSTPARGSTRSFPGGQQGQRRRSGPCTQSRESRPSRWRSASLLSIGRRTRHERGIGTETVDAFSPAFRRSPRRSGSPSSTTIAGSVRWRRLHSLAMPGHAAAGRVTDKRGGRSPTRRSGGPPASPGCLIRGSRPSTISPIASMSSSRSRAAARRSGVTADRGRSRRPTSPVSQRQIGSVSRPSVTGTRFPACEATFVEVARASGGRTRRADARAQSNLNQRDRVHAEVVERGVRIRRDVQRRLPRIGDQRLDRGDRSGRRQVQSRPCALDRFDDRLPIGLSGRVQRERFEALDQRSTLRRAKSDGRPDRISGLVGLGDDRDREDFAARVRSAPRRPRRPLRIDRRFSSDRPSIRRPFTFRSPSARPCTTMRPPSRSAFVTAVEPGRSTSSRPSLRNRVGIDRPTPRGWDRTQSRPGWSGSQRRSVSSATTSTPGMGWPTGRDLPWRRAHFEIATRQRPASVEPQLTRRRVDPSETRGTRPRRSAGRAPRKGAERECARNRRRRSRCG